MKIKFNIDDRKGFQREDVAHLNFWRSKVAEELGEAEYDVVGDGGDTLQFDVDFNQVCESLCRLNSQLPTIVALAHA